MQQKRKKNVCGKVVEGEDNKHTHKKNTQILTHTVKNKELTTARSYCYVSGNGVNESASERRLSGQLAVMLVKALKISMVDQIKYANKFS